jgi:hypothetical protein
MTPPEDDIRYWKAQADELQGVVSRLETRLSAIVRLLPLDRLVLLDKDGDAADTLLRSRDLFEGWEETTALTVSDVGTEMSLVWERLALPEES